MRGSLRPVGLLALTGWAREARFPSTAGSRGFPFVSRHARLAGVEADAALAKRDTEGRLAAPATGGTYVP